MTEHFCLFFIGGRKCVHAEMLGLLSEDCYLPYVCFPISACFGEKTFLFIDTLYMNCAQCSDKG